VNKWQYAWLTDQPQTTLGFSHPQPGLGGELTAILGPTVLTAQSTEWSIAFDRQRANLGYISGLMGDRGWEMFSVVNHPQGGPMGGVMQTNWYFRRPVEG
jgi:hypothetical protein